MKIQVIHSICVHLRQELVLRLLYEFRTESHNGRAVSPGKTLMMPKQVPVESSRRVLDRVLARHEIDVKCY